jgi:SRSO17 transposase
MKRCWKPNSGQANRLVGRPNAILVIDDTALLKNGTHSMGVASQYAEVVGKRATSDIRCQ